MQGQVCKAAETRPVLVKAPFQGPLAGIQQLGNLGEVRGSARRQRRRSRRAVVILVSPNTLAHSLKLRLVVITTLVRS